MNHQLQLLNPPKILWGIWSFFPTFAAVIPTSYTDIYDQTVLFVDEAIHCALSQIPDLGVDIELRFPMVERILFCRYHPYSEHLVQNRHKDL